MKKIRILSLLINIILLVFILPGNMIGQELNNKKTIEDDKLFSYWSFDNDTDGHSLDLAADESDPL